MQTGAKETAKTEARYNRITPIYDLMEVFPERRPAPMRQKLWSQIPDGEVLEVGVGTGKNSPFHQPEIKVTGIDLSDRMLEQARRRAEKLGKSIELKQMDAQRLDSRDDSFDAAVAMFVFCSVRGLRELSRVVKPEGRILLLEHGGSTSRRPSAK